MSSDTRTSGGAAANFKFHSRAIIFTTRAAAAAAAADDDDDDDGWKNSRSCSNPPLPVQGENIPVRGNPHSDVSSIIKS